MKRLIIPGLLILAITGFFAMRKEERVAVPTQDTSSQPVSTALPQPLRPVFPETIAEPSNPCSDLTVDEAIRANRETFADRAREADAYAARLRAQLTLPKELDRGNPDRRVVSLTIDTGTGGADGIPQLLDIAAHYKIPLTFFLTGCWMLENPELTQRIMSEGHSIANHTLTHLNLASASDEEAEREIAETERILRDITGISPAIFRKPQYAGGERIRGWGGRHGMVSVRGYPDFGDTTGWREGVTSDDVLALVSRKTVPGAIWVFHNLSSSDLRAFEDVVRFHLEEEYALVRVEDLLAPAGE